MNKHRARAPLRIRPRPSRYLAAFLLATHCAALAVVFAFPVLWYWCTGLALLVLASFAYVVGVHLLFLIPWSVREAIWAGDGAWILTLASGEQVDARLLPSTYATRRLLVLNFRRGRWWTRSLVLLPDALDADLLRRLRVRLRLAGARDAAGTDGLA